MICILLTGYGHSDQESPDLSMHIYVCLNTHLQCDQDKCMHFMNIFCSVVAALKIKHGKNCLSTLLRILTERQQGFDFAVLSV